MSSMNLEFVFTTEARRPKSFAFKNYIFKIFSVFLSDLRVSVFLFTMKFYFFFKIFSVFLGDLRVSVFLFTTTALWSQSLFLFSNLLCVSRWSPCLRVFIYHEVLFLFQNFLCVSRWSPCLRVPICYRWIHYFYRPKI